ncbi:hypothetical protein ACFPOH_06415 [Ureibacillus suwonensis]|uniref:Alcohol dehydrogenase n=1 Tax=Ureibacillus suwonensis TaxID=313007 RepID=A0ABW0R9N7_9BACL
MALIKGCEVYATDISPEARFATGKMSPKLITIPFEEIDKSLEKLKNHEVKGRLVAVFD